MNGGLGLIFNNFLVQAGLRDVEVLNIGIPDRWVQFGSNKELMRELGLDAESVTERIWQEFGFELIHDDRIISQ